MTYFQGRQRNHEHRYFLDADDPSKLPACLCGKEKGKKLARPHKYNAKSTFYNGSHYDSMREAAHAAELDLLLRAGKIKSWERQIPIEIKVKGYSICTNKVDFLVHHLDGTKELVEIKGFETADYRIKKKLIEAVYLVEHPEFTYTVIK